MSTLPAQLPDKRPDLIQSVVRIALLFGNTPALRGAHLCRVAHGEDPRHHGSERFLGKSTLLHCLAGILVSRLRAGPPSSGRRVDKMGEQERSALRRDHFGFVFQFGQLVSQTSAEENVALPLLLAGVIAARRSRRPESGSSDCTSKDWRSAGRESSPADKPNGSRSPAAWLRVPGPLRGRADRIARLADRRARHGAAG